MDKGKRSLYTAITSLVLTVLTGLAGLVITKLVITNYGSDFNGLNSTVSQFISMLLIVEGGFTLATNVALFKPITCKDYRAINGIMSATRNTFNKIGGLFFILGTILAIGYSLIIKTNLPLIISILIFLMAVLSTSINLFYATKYKILLQTEQREYILNIINIGTVLIFQPLIILVIFSNGHMLFIRFATMLGAIANSLLIGIVCKRQYKALNFNVEPDYKSIKGTKDIFIQKITSMVYSTIPMLFIAATVGTLYASVYYVYNSIFSLLKSVIYSFINAPVMGFGNLIAEKSKDYVLKVFLQYEFIVDLVMLSLLSAASVLIMPFISIYTKGVNDIEYKAWYLALLLIFIAFFEIIHIPSGNIINMAGKFQVGRRIQTIASVFLVAAMLLGNIILGFYGILLAVLLTAVLLAIMEIYYVHVIYFEKTYAGLKFFQLLLPSTLFMIVMVYFEIRYIPTITGYIALLTVGAALVIINAFALFGLNMIINRKMLFEVIYRIGTVIPKRTR